MDIRVIYSHLQIWNIQINRIVSSLNGIIQMFNSLLEYGKCGTIRTTETEIKKFITHSWLAGSSCAIYFPWMKLRLIRKKRMGISFDLSISDWLENGIFF